MKRVRIHIDRITLEGAADGDGVDRAITAAIERDLARVIARRQLGYAVSASIHEAIQSALRGARSK